MRCVILMPAITALALGLVACSSQPASPESSASEVGGDADFASELEKGSYAVGFSFGRGLQGRKVEVSLDELIEGLSDAMTGREGRLSEQDVTVIANQVQNAARRRILAERQEMIARNEAAGAAFMEANKARPEVVSVPSGLQYEVLVPGSGPKPTASDRVKLQWSISTLDGEPVDNTYERGGAQILELSRVLPIFENAVPLMPEGSKWRVWAPPHLGFGEFGQGSRNIPPGATLVFEIEFISIEPPEG